MKTLAIIVAGYVARELWRANQTRRAITIAGAQFSFDIGTHADAYRFVTGELSVDEYERRQDARDAMLTAAYRGTK